MHWICCTVVQPTPWGEPCEKEQAGNRKTIFLQMQKAILEGTILVLAAAITRRFQQEMSQLCLSVLTLVDPERVWGTRKV